MRALAFGFIGLAALTSVSHSGEVQPLQTPPLMRQARTIPLPYISGRVLFRPNDRVFISASQVDGPCVWFRREPWDAGDYLGPDISLHSELTAQRRHSNPLNCEICDCAFSYLIDVGIYCRVEKP